MTLKEYFEITGLKKTFFAEKIGVCRQLLSVWIHGKKMPRLETIMKIEEATGGKVKPKDWITERNMKQKQSQL
jgi:transcriptional regulator with XRE-family HTH domain